MNKGKILVVDDDRLVLATLSQGLTHAGFEVVSADNGDDAILLAHQHRPGLALLDIRMDGLSGFDVAVYLRDHLRTPFIFLSAFADAATIERVAELGALAYLIKPLDIQQIAPAVEMAFARARQIGPAASPHLHPALEQEVALALGIVMQREGLSRGAALARLQGLAAAAGLTLAQQAARELAALESSSPSVK
ncbi:MAG: response regulator [Paucibacter sp.]|nr:response regulator [Roseateles sp.]